MKKTDNLRYLEKLVKFSHLFNQVQRKVIVNGGDRLENDSEHSFQLAFISWCIIDSQKLKLDVNKVIKYALVHDLVEVYAGDTFFYNKNPNFKNIKKQKEKDSLAKIKKQFPEIKMITKLIEEYEKLDCEEAKFVYALDKILVVINIYLDNGRSWKAHKVNIKMLLSKKEKVALSPVVNNYWQEILDYLKRNEEKFFDEK